MIDFRRSNAEKQNCSPKLNTGGFCVKENEQRTYVREYSELDGLQKAAEVRYALNGDAGVYRFSVTRLPEKRQTTFRLAGVTGRAAQSLLCFLYENAVPPEHAFSVAQDCTRDPAVVLRDEP